MFLRLLRHLPILVPHGGLVVGSYGHVDDLCDAMLEMATHPAAVGEVFNVTGGSVDVNRYVATLARVVGAAPVVVAVPPSMAADLEVASPPVFGHLFKAAHHASITTDKLQRMLGHRSRYDLESGHAQTFEWFLEQGWDRLAGPLADAVWKSSWDFAAESDCVERIRRA